jgi:MOSC domain-containing protein YiiM
MGKIAAICVSERKHVPKQEIEWADVIEGYGLAGDAHAGTERQVSLLAMQDLDRMRELMPELKPGDFAENLLVTGISVQDISPGTVLRVGRDTLLEVTVIGKKCHRACDIFRQIGKCIMPTRGVFARVLQGGRVFKGDPAMVVREHRTAAG